MSGNRNSGGDRSNNPRRGNLASSSAGSGPSHGGVTRTSSSSFRADPFRSGHSLADPGLGQNIFPTVGLPYPLTQTASVPASSIQITQPLLPKTQGSRSGATTPAASSLSSLSHSIRLSALEGIGSLPDSDFPNVSRDTIANYNRPSKFVFARAAEILQENCFSRGIPIFVARQDDDGYAAMYNLASLAYDEARSDYEKVRKGRGRRPRFPPFDSEIYSIIGSRQAVTLEEMVDVARPLIRVHFSIPEILRDAAEAGLPAEAVLSTYIRGLTLGNGGEASFQSTLGDLFGPCNGSLPHMSFTDAGSKKWANLCGRDVYGAYMCGQKTSMGQRQTSRFKFTAEHLLYPMGNIWFASFLALFEWISGSFKKMSFSTENWRFLRHYALLFHTMVDVAARDPSSGIKDVINDWYTWANTGFHVGVHDEDVFEDLSVKYPLPSAHKTYDGTDASTISFPTYFAALIRERAEAAGRLLADAGQQAQQGGTFHRTCHAVAQGQATPALASGGSSWDEDSAMESDEELTTSEDRFLARDQERYERRLKVHHRHIYGTQPKQMHGGESSDIEDTNDTPGRQISPTPGPTFAPDCPGTLPSIDIAGIVDVLLQSTEFQEFQGSSAEQVSQAAEGASQAMELTLSDILREEYILSPSPPPSNSGPDQTDA